MMDIFKQIGDPLQGGMGQIIHLYHTAWNLHMAYKQPLTDLLQTKNEKERFYDECERWISLGLHPNIVQCFYFGEKDQIPGAYMEWMEGGSLEDQIECGKLYVGSKSEILMRILKLAIQIAKGLSYSHKKGILHLDVKPANVLLDEDGCAKVTDFGISSLLNQQQRKVGYTLLYCAPEQRNGDTVNERTDIYCWGVTLLHMLVKEASWMEGTVVGYAYDYYLENAAVDIPDTLAELLKDCLCIQNEQRPVDFSVVIARLQKIYHKVSGTDYTDDDERYASISLDAYNNSAISYFNLGYKEKAAVMWQRAHWHNTYYHCAYLNRRLSEFLMGQSKDPDFFASKYHSIQIQEALKSLSEQEKQQIQQNMNRSIGAYQLIESSGQRRLFGSSEIWKKNCILLSWVWNNWILYLSRKGLLTLYNPEALKERKNYILPLKEITHAAVSHDGKYLAIAQETVDAYKYRKYEIQILHLESMKCCLKAVGSAGSYELKNLSFIENFDDYPRLVANFGWKLYDWKLKEKYQEYSNSMQNGIYQGLIEKVTLPVMYMSDGYGYSLVLFSNSKCYVYDAFTLEELGSTVSSFFRDYKIRSIQQITGESALLVNTENLGYLIYDYSQQGIVSQGHSGYSGMIAYPHISVNDEENALFMLPGGEVRIGKFPEYGDLPEPVWEMRPFKTTKQMLMECKQVLQWKDSLEANIRKIAASALTVPEKLRYMLISRLRDIREYYKNSFRSYREYLQLAALTSCILEPKWVYADITQYSSEKLRILKPNDFGDIMSDTLPMITLRQAMYGCELCWGKRVLATINYSYSGILGITEDYCYLVCQNSPYSRNNQYMLIQLEWKYEEKK